MPLGASVRTPAGAPVPASTGRQTGIRAMAAPMMVAPTRALSRRPGRASMTGARSRGAADRPSLVPADRPSAASADRPLRGAADRPSAHSPATVTTAMPGHHATPRDARAPSAAKPISPRRAPTRILWPRRTRRTTATVVMATLPQNRSPGTSVSMGGCHSETWAVICALPAIPMAYSQTRQPNGVANVAATVAISTVTRCRVLPRAPRSPPAMPSMMARPTSTGARTKLPWRLAQTAPMTGMAHIARGRVRFAASTTSVSANSAMARSCGRSARAGA